MEPIGWIGIFSSKWGDGFVHVVSAPVGTACQILEFLGAALISVACIRPADSTPSGQAITASQCKACHGLEGKAVAPGIPNLAGQRQTYLMKTFDEFRDGSRVHGSLQAVVTQLSENEAKAVAQYYASLQSTRPIRGKPFDAYAAGKQLAENCMSCHGSDGNSKTPGVPSLAGQQPKYTFNATQEYMTGVRHSAPMNPMLARLDRLDVESLALFYASQKPLSLHAPANGDIAKGQSLSVVCGGCHGAGGVSTDADTPSIAGQDPDYLQETLQRYRSAERKNNVMTRAVTALTTQDINDLAAFYSSQILKANEIGQTLIPKTVEKCDRCHGDVANNLALGIPLIGGQDKDYLVMALRAYRDGKRGSSLMHYMSEPYNDAIIESIASHYASQ